MNPLSNIKNGTLYTLDCTFYSSVQYNRKSLDSVIFIFSEKPSKKLPEKLFLMPEGKEYDYRAFIYTLSGELETYCPDGTSQTWYLIQAVTNDIPEQRKNFRVYTTFQAFLLLEGHSKEIPVTVKDIGTGGFQFISKEKFEPGTSLSTILSSGIKTPACITARIQKQRPVRQKGVYAYGCQFINLPKNVEAMIRNFVFQTEVLQAKAKKEREKQLSQ